MGAIAYCRSVQKEVAISPARWEKTPAEQTMIDRLEITVEQVTCQEKPARICRICTGKAYESFGSLQLQETKKGKWIQNRE